jgi:hypothetical protein
VLMHRATRKRAAYYNPSPNSKPGYSRNEAQRRGPSRLRAVQLDAQFKQLQYVQRNLLRIIRGERIGGGWEGGISGVH